MPLSLRSRQIETHGPVLLVHGGAWDIPGSALEAHREGLQSMLGAGRSTLQSGTHAVTGVAGGCITVTPEEAAMAFTIPRMARAWTDGADTRHRL